MWAEFVQDGEKAATTRLGRVRIRTVLRLARDTARVETNGRDSKLKFFSSGIMGAVSTDVATADSGGEGEASADNEGLTSIVVAQTSRLIAANAQY
ncbi:MAG: hypothetical protein H7301_04725 [Cryobacterium sp.]|nr:hypothetical protein [Oligoflexia bacterium]